MATSTMRRHLADGDAAASFFSPFSRLETNCFPAHFLATFEQLRKADRMSILRTSALLLLLPLSALPQTSSDITSKNKIKFADQFPGADACVQIQNAIADLPVNGGEVDARAILGFLTCSVNPFAHILNKPGESVHLHLAAGSTYTTSAQWIVPLGSIITGGGSAPGGGRGTTLVADRSSFPRDTAVVLLGDAGQSEGS